MSAVILPHTIESCRESLQGGNDLTNIIIGNLREQAFRGLFVGHHREPAFRGHGFTAYLAANDASKPFERREHFGLHLHAERFDALGNCVPTLRHFTADVEQ